MGNAILGTATRTLAQAPRRQKAGSGPSTGEDQLKRRTSAAALVAEQEIYKALSIATLNCPKVRDWLGDMDMDRLTRCPECHATEFLHREGCQLGTRLSLIEVNTIHAALGFVRSACAISGMTKYWNHYGPIFEALSDRLVQETEGTANANPNADIEPAGGNG